jgi:hypothetical protein
LETRLNQNSGNFEYQSVRQLSQLFDGPIFGSKWSTIYELQLSELGRTAEIENFGQTGPFGKNWSLGKILP